MLLKFDVGQNLLQKGYLTSRLVKKNSAVFVNSPCFQGIKVKNLNHDYMTYNCHNSMQVL